MKKIKVPPGNRNEEYMRKYLEHRIDILTREAKIHLKHSKLNHLLISKGFLGVSPVGFAEWLFKNTEVLKLTNLNQLKLLITNAKLIEYSKIYTEQTKNLLDKSNIKTEQNEDDRLLCESDPGKYFRRLNQEKVSGSPIMDEVNVDHFLRANFRGFGDNVPRKKFTTLLTQKELRYFVYQFYRMNTVLGVQVFIDLLHDNFTEFDVPSRLTTSKKFSSRPSRFQAFSLFEGVS